MDHHPDNWGRSRYDHVIQARSIKPITHTQSPIVTGTSVLAIRYKDGIMMAADCLGMFRSKSADILASYGSLARFRDLQRMTQLGETTLLGTSGDISDFQFTTNMLKQYHIEETCCDDGHVLSPRQWYTALSAYMYQRRSKMDPLWNTNIVAGVDKHTGEQYNPIHYGFGAYLAQPILRDAVEGKAALNEDEARALLEKCMTVLWYRDARSMDLIQMAKVTAEGVTISDAYQLRQDWSVAKYQFN